ncbi:MAG: terpene cyclase/mutase family protein [Bacteroidetes bacterium]|nr:terpene cyclase/mutase family protein [Bacteroidota bacterium]
MSSKNHPYKIHQTAALKWLKKSFEVHDFAGSAAFYSRFRHPFKGWAPPYPETSGYLLETLLKHQGEADWIEEALRKTTQWLCSIQMPSGAFPALYANSGKASVFNSGMILFGLAAMQELSLNPQQKEAIQKGGNWIINQLTPDGFWEENNSPTYYSRVLWALLRCAEWLDLPKEKLQHSLEKYLDRASTYYTFEKWGFQASDRAFTHTIAYTLRGFWEAGFLLNNVRATSLTEGALERLSESLKTKEIAGRYDLHWNGEHRFQCLPGNFQLATLLLRAGKKRQREDFRESGKVLLDNSLKFQKTDPKKETCGGLPGSFPIYGSYMRFKYPNWGPKFLLDAVWEYQYS